MTERDVFEAALELLPENRPAYLDGVCADDAALRPRLEALLIKHDGAGSFLQIPAVPVLFTIDEPAVSERPGTLIHSPSASFMIEHRLSVAQTSSRSPRRSGRVIG
jgi:hypothetical protein